MQSNVPGVQLAAKRSQPGNTKVNNKIPGKSESQAEPNWKGCKCGAMDLEAARNVAPVVTGFNITKPVMPHGLHKDCSI